MASRRVDTSTSREAPSQEKISKTGGRSSAPQTQRIARRPPTPVELENDAFHQNKSKALKLQLKAKRGTITPVEQGDLGVLQLKMEDFWAQRSDRATRLGHSVVQAAVQRRSALPKRQGGTSQAQAAPAPSESQTPMPAPLKAGLEHLSGLDISNVRVHRNSPKPAQLGALAFTQGRAPTPRAAGIQRKNIALEVSSSLGRKPSGTTVIQRLALTLPNASGRGEVWKVDTRGEGRQAIVGWIEQAAKTNPLALRELIVRLGAVAERDPLEQRLLFYALAKFEESQRLRGLEESADARNATNPRNYIDAQERYQNALLESGRSKSEIMSSHRSFGSEFEFATYGGVKEQSSHIILASSAPLSELFPIPFELETDSGSVLEIGMPPFLVKNLPNGKPDKGSIAVAHNAMRGAMAKVRDQAKDQTIEWLTMHLDREGLGKTWRMNTEAKKRIPGFMDMRVGQGKTPGKFEDTRDDIYEQLNLSMTGDESAAIIEMFMGNERLYGSAEKGELGEMYRRLGGSLDGIDAGLAVHIRKSITGILAIPSVMLSQEGQSSIIPDGYDLESNVKELAGVWVKDSLPNIMKTLSAKVPGDIEEKLKGAVAILKDGIETVVSQIKSSEDLKALKKLHERYSGSEYGGEGEGGVLSGFGSESLHRKNLSVFIGQMDKELKNEGAKREEEPNWGKFYDIHADFKKYISEEMRQEEVNSPAVRIRNAMLAELDKLVKNLRVSSILRRPEVRFQKETFGGNIAKEGVGVRKDTFVPNIATEGGRMSVGELRGHTPIRKFLEED